MFTYNLNFKKQEKNHDEITDALDAIINALEILEANGVELVINIKEDGKIDINIKKEISSWQMNH